ncbi:MAG: hypothetical protein LBE18_03965 [Planctomycetaceae bacterium]|jgi:hypothetical protein|nr:hypothetical protein [Planctomycetaceae bacterium]
MKYIQFNLSFAFIHQRQRILKYVCCTLLLTLVFLTFSGCQTLRGLFDRTDPKPTAHPVSAKPTLNELIDPINRNSMMIRNISADNVSLTFPDVPTPLNVRLNCERPKRIRIIGGTSITGREIDFGSNDELFWIGIKRERNLYFCRHSQFPTCPVRNALPIEPDWLIEALGIIEFKNNEQHEGPYPSGDGNWIIITRRSTPTGQFVKKTTIESKTGLVSKQEMFSPQNDLITAAVSSDHRFDVQNGITYARKIEIFYASSAGKIIINLGSPQFNQTTNSYSSLYTMPPSEGRNIIDICSEEFLRSQNININTAPNAAPLNNSIVPSNNINNSSSMSVPAANSNVPNVHLSTQPAVLIPSTLSKNTIHNSIQQNNNIPTYRYNNSITSQGTYHTEIK